MSAGYAIECDVRLAVDGEAVVFHDTTLERLTQGEGPVSVHSAAELSRLALCNTSDTISLSGDFLATVGGKSPLIVSIKSDFDGSNT